MKKMVELTQSQNEAIGILTSTAERLEAAVSSLSGEELDYSPGPAEWTIRQIVHHLVDGSIIWAMIFNRALAMSGEAIHSLGGFPGNEAWADALDFDKRPIGTAVALVVSHHRFMAEAASFFPDRWERYVTIPNPDGKEVEITVGQIIQMIGEHLAEHVATIDAIKRQHGI